mgnify:CR=1 FL=1
MNRLLFTTIVAATLALCAAATAGECNAFFCHANKQVVANHVQAVVLPHVAQVVAYPQVLYQAGYNIEIEAAVTKVIRRELSAFEYRQQQRYQPQQANVPPPAPQNIVAEKCGSCHGGAAPKAGLTLDGVTPVPCASVLESLRQIKDDKMPKGGKLSPEEKGLLMEALLQLEAK